MYGGNESFFSVITGPLLVRDGADVKLPGSEHNMFAVYGEMLLQVCQDYSGIGDFRKLKLNEIEFFYNGIRHDLKKSTKPRPKGK